MKQSFRNYFLFLAILGTLLFTSGCSKEGSSNKSEYYIKYEIISNSSPYVGVKLNINYTGEDGSKTSRQISTGKWETTIGPFTSGSHVSLDATKNNWSGGDEYHLKMELNIYESKDNGPFALKSSDASTTPRAKAAIMHTIK